ncbi:MAG: hypothetical protein K6G15_08665 [Desulfovibrio sp.]|nr:hypothetical protein [Desulfovibrio sp.]
MAGESNAGESCLVLGLGLCLVFWLAFSDSLDAALRGFLLALARFELQAPDVFWQWTGCASHWQAAQSVPFTSPLPDWPSLLSFCGLASEPFGRISAVLILLLFVISLRLSVRERFCQTHTMQSLLRQNVRQHPCLAPILNWGRSLICEDLDSGPWMSARQPLQFAAEHGLLLDAKTGQAVSPGQLLRADHLANGASPLLGGAQLVLDGQKARKIFSAQLGPRFTGLDHMPAYLLALAVSFALFALDQKEASRSLLNQLSLSFRPKQSARTWALRRTPPFVQWPRKASPYRICAKLPLSSSQVQALFAREEIAQVIRPHNQYTHLLVYALFALARRRGVLTCAEMIWLKPVNRSLFYLLNNFGRRTAWVEVAGALAHYRVEEGLCAQLGDFSACDLSSPCVDEAVQGLSLALYDEGWLATKGSDG